MGTSCVFLNCQVTGRTFQAKLREREHALKQRMLLGKSQRSSAALRHSATSVGVLPTVPSAGSEEGLAKEPCRSESTFGPQKALHGSFSNTQQGHITSPRFVPRDAKVCCNCISLSCFKDATHRCQCQHLARKA